jgi:hypothetical protein
VADTEEADMLHTRIITIGVVALALAAPTAAGAQQDLRSPDTRDAAAAATTGQDLRSPDTLDATRPITPAQAPAPVQPYDRTPDGFAWGDASIGAAGMLGIALALTGIALLTTHRRRGDHAPVARH